MRAQIIKIGNSQGIRIPKVILEQVGLKQEVELEVADNQIIIKAINKSRKGWNEAFLEMAKQGDDKLIDGDVSSNWDEEQWQWS